jgi:RluA family pseudouridine synthase
MEGLESLSDLFDQPWPPLPVGPPPFGPDSAKSIMGAVSGAYAGKRAFELVMALSGLDEEASKELVDFGSLWLGGKLALEPEGLLSPGEYRLNLPQYRPRIFYEINPERVVFEDGDLIVYDKEAGCPSQGVPRDARNNVLAAMERRTGKTLRLIHRLDAPTSGLLMIAATKQAASRAAGDLARHAVGKRYLALTRGEPPSWRETVVDAPIGKERSRYVVAEEGRGAPAKTRLTYLAREGELVLFLAEPLTGRTHQIRLHMAKLGYPIIGDEFYGGHLGPRLMLRASGLRLKHPGDASRLLFGGPWEESEISKGG